MHQHIPPSLLDLPPTYPHPTCLGHQRAQSWVPLLDGRFPPAIYFEDLILLRTQQKSLSGERRLGKHINFCKHPKSYFRMGGYTAQALEISWPINMALRKAYSAGAAIRGLHWATVTRVPVWFLEINPKYEGSVCKDLSVCRYFLLYIEHTPNLRLSHRHLYPWSCYNSHRTSFHSWKHACLERNDLVLLFKPICVKWKESLSLAVSNHSPFVAHTLEGIH